MSIKKAIFAVFFVCILVFTFLPTKSSAQTSNDTIIQTLLEQIKTLQAQIDSLIKEQATQSTTSSEVSTTMSENTMLVSNSETQTTTNYKCITFSPQAYVFLGPVASGSTQDPRTTNDVKNLQRFLVERMYMPIIYLNVSNGFGTFGPVTKAAVDSFLKDAGISPNIAGVLNKISLDKISEISCSSSGILWTDRSQITTGEVVTLHWKSENVQGCIGTSNPVAQGWNGDEKSKDGGSITVTAESKTTTYFIHCGGWAWWRGLPVQVGLKGQVTVTVSAGVMPPLPGATPSLKIVSPNGGETYKSGSSIPTTWSVNYDSSNITVYVYSPTRGNVFISPTVKSEIGKTNYSIPPEAFNPAGEYKITLCDNTIETSGKNLCDSSDNYFTVLPSVPTAAPTVSLTASPTNVTSGQAVVLTLHSTNTSSCGGTNVSEGKTIGTNIVYPTQTTTYTVKCLGNDGTSVSQSVTVNVTTQSTPTSRPIGIKSVSYSPASPKVNDWITTAVTVVNTSSFNQGTPFQVNVQGTTVTVPSLAAGAQNVVTVPNAFTFDYPGTFTLNTAVIYPIPGTNTGNTGDVFTNTITFSPISFPSIPTISLIANPSQVYSGQSTTLTWSTKNATSCDGKGFSTYTKTAGSAQVVPTASGFYSITCFNDPAYGTNGPSASAQVTVNVSSAPTPTPAPVVTLSASPSIITAGQAVTLSWSNSSDPSGSCARSWSNSTTPMSGYQTVSPSQTTIYTISCMNSEGISASKSVTVNVTSAPTPIPAPTVSFTASPTNIGSGSGSYLSWGSTNATSCRFSNSSVVYSTSGSILVTPPQTIAYTLTCSGVGGSTSQSVTIYVNVPSSGTPVDGSDRFFIFETQKTDQLAGVLGAIEKLIEEIRKSF